MLSLSHYYFLLSFLEVYFLPLSVNCVLPLLAQCTFHLTLFHQSASGNWVPMAMIIKGYSLTDELGRFVEITSSYHKWGYILVDG